MALACRRRGAIALVFLGALALCWNVILTTHYLSSALPGRNIDGGGILPPQAIVGLEDAQSGKIDTVTPNLANATSGNTSVHKVDNQDGGKVHLVANGYFPRTIDMEGVANPQPLTPGSNKTRRIYIDRHTLQTWKHIEGDKNYPTVQESPPQEECIPMSSWHTYSYPSCNVIHEVDLHRKALSDAFNYVASGGYNDVFRIRNRKKSPTELNAYPDLAMKKLSPGKKHKSGIPQRREYSHDNYDIVRRDALILALTNSSQVLPLYGYCGFAVVVPFADGGTLASVLSKEWSREDRGWKGISSTERLKYAIDASKGLAAIHDINVVHADLTVKQYLVWNGRLQLGDFNQGILLSRNSSAPDSACTFQMTKNYGTTRAPEEYSHKPQTSAVDVWSLGSVLYHILTGKKVWGNNYKKQEAQGAVVKGMLPEIDKSILNSSDPVDKLLKDAFGMCSIYEPSQRATAREVATYLEKGWIELGLRM